MILLLKNYKLRLFDIVIAASILTFSFTLYAFLYRTSKPVTVTIKVNEESLVTPNRGISPWFANQFHEGMIEKDTFGRVMATIKQVRKYDNGFRYNYNDAVYTESFKKTVYLTTQLQAVYSPGSTQYTYKGKNILVGSTIQLNLNSLFVEGLIVYVNGAKSPYPESKLKVETRLIDYVFIFPETQGVMPFLADSIQEGNEIKDPEGKTVLRVIKKQSEDALKIVTTSSGDVFLRRDPIKKDVYLTLEVTAHKIGDRYYFSDDYPLLIEQTIPIHLPTVSLWPVITHIEEIK